MVPFARPQLCFPDQVPIQIDRDGNLTNPPDEPAFILTSAAVLGFDLVLGGWAAGCSLGKRLLHAGPINATGWDVQWARAEPGWSRRTWH